MILSEMHTAKAYQPCLTTKIHACDKRLAVQDIGLKGAAERFPPIEAQLSEMEKYIELVSSWSWQDHVK